MSKLFKIKAILNKKNGQIVMTPSKKELKRFDENIESEIRKGRKMLFEWRGFE